MSAYDFHTGHSFPDYDSYDDPEEQLSLQESAAEKAAEELALHALADDADLLWHAEPDHQSFENFGADHSAAAQKTDFTDPDSVSEFIEEMTADALLSISPERVLDIVEEVTTAWGRALEIR